LNIKTELAECSKCCPPTRWPSS